MKKKYKIIFVSQNPGGFDALLPVFQLIKKNKNYKKLLFLAGKSREIAKSLRVKFINADGFLMQDVEKAIKNERPDLVFVTTSSKNIDPSLDKKFILSAKKKNILTIAIVDFWSSYKERFGDKFEYLPDYVLAIDERMKKQMIEEGVNKDKIFISGNPCFDKFKKTKRYREEKNLVVFYSQLLDLYEIEIFKDFLGIIEKIGPEKNIVLKLHPRENNSKKFDEIIKNSKLKIKKIAKGKAEDLSKRAELIVGINSRALFDAALMGKKVLSYQPEKSKNQDCLISNIEGGSVGIYKKEFFLPELKKILTKNPIKKKNFYKFHKKYAKNRSTEKVINFIEKLLKRKKIVCIIQARMGSTRLPGKIMLDLVGKPVLLRVVDRVLESKKINQIIIATTTNPNDQKIVSLIENYHPKVFVYQGSEEDVLDRYYRVAEYYKADFIVRITSDCPLIDPEIIDKVINVFIKGKDLDYTSNVLSKRTYPRGLDVEVISFKALKKTWQDTYKLEDREHVTLYIRKNLNLFKSKNVTNIIDYSHYRWTIDEKVDYNLIKTIYQELYLKNPNFKMKEIINFLKKKPELIKINQNVKQKLSHF